MHQRGWARAADQLRVRRWQSSYLLRRGSPGKAKASPDAVAAWHICLNGKPLENAGVLGPGARPRRSQGILAVLSPLA